MRYDLIVVGTDGSENARVTEAVALAVAKAAGGELLFVWGYQDEGGRSGAKAAVEAARARAVEAGTSARGEVVQGEPAGAIVEVADRSEAKLVVVGDEDMGKRKRVGLGGTADRISHSMPCDTLIVRTGRSNGHGGYRKVLLATDGSSTASHATRVGGELARGMGAAIEIVHVRDPVMGAVILKEAAEMLGDPGIPGYPLTAEPGAGIAEVARDHGHDLVVVGNKGMSGSIRIRIGKVPDLVSHLAPCDVLIVNTVDRSLGDILPGEGAVVAVDGRKVAAFRETDGTVVMLSAKCRHRGCTVGWNEVAGTWDCPCHGSRYEARGKLIQGPATRDLPPAEVETGS
jgi:nucleotide-binding universal stress UspA family protein/nitrite reductase/ring-hydroxylating ferredoxin subunit